MVATEMSSAVPRTLRSWPPRYSDGLQRRRPEPLEHAVGPLEGDGRRQVAVGDDDDGEGEDARHEQGEDS